MDRRRYKMNRKNISIAISYVNNLVAFKPLYSRENKRTTFIFQAIKYKSTKSKHNLNLY